MSLVTIYDENVEWVFSSGSGSYHPADMSNPHTGVIDLVYNNNVGGSRNVGNFAAPSPIQSSLMSQLSLWFLPSNWAAGRTVILNWGDTGNNQVGIPVTIQNGTFGFNTSSAVYQNVVIPMSLFGIPPGAQVGFLGISSSVGVFVYLLDTVVLTLLNVNCDPSTLANAAICFEQCIPDPSQVRTYLLCQFLTACRSPLAPTGLEVTASTGNPGPTTITIDWSQPLQVGGPNITGYLVKWGTASGNYNTGSAVIPVAPLSYTITGLNPLTTYFVVVEALATSCPSPNSNEISTTTTASCVVGPVVLNWVSRVQANGGAAPSLNTQCAVQTLVTGLQAAGLDTSMLYVLLYVPDSLIATLTPLYHVNGVDPSQNQSFVAGDLTINGLAGDGTTKNLQPLLNPTTMTWNTASNCGISIYSMDGISQTTMGEVGLRKPSNSAVNILLFVNLSGTSYAEICGFPTGTASGAAPGVGGFYAGNRTAVNAAALYFANSTTPFAALGTTAAAAGTPPNRAMAIHGLANDDNGGTPDFLSTRRISYCSFHTGFTAAQQQTEFNLVQAFRRTLGGGFV